MPWVKPWKILTPTRTRDTYLINSQNKTTPGTSKTSTTDITPSTNKNDTAKDQYLTDTINKISSKKLWAILTGKDVIRKELRVCVLQNNEARLRDISL